MRRTKRRSKVLAALSVFTLVTIAACGGDDDDDSSEATTGTEAISEGTEAPTRVHRGADRHDRGGAGDDGRAARTPNRRRPTRAAARKRWSRRASATSTTTRASRSTAARCATASTPTRPTRGRRIETSCATSCYVAAVGRVRLAVPLRRRRQPGAAAARERRAQRRLHGVDAHRPRRHHVPRRHAARRRGGQVQHRDVHVLAADRRRATSPNIASVAAEGQTVTITTERPVGGACRTTSRYGAVRLHVLAAVAGQPAGRARSATRRAPIYDAELAATPADGDPAAPVGLGAFVFESYTPGNGNVFRAVRNEDYWRGPNGITGENLPYLDAIEAVVFVDAESRLERPALGRDPGHAHGQRRLRQPVPRRRRVRADVGQQLRRDRLHPASTTRPTRRSTPRARTPAAR